MTDGAGGLGATEDDAFFAEVRRRHPDVDVVLLGEQEPRTEQASQLPDDGLAGVAAAVADAARDLWGDLLRGRSTDEERARWIAGEARGSVAREVSLAGTDVDEVEAQQELIRAQRLLADAGWRVLAPPTGMPRVLAGRGEGGGRQDLQIVYAPTGRRVSLRLRGPSYTVGATASAELLAGAR